MLSITESFLQGGIPSIADSSGVDIEEGVAGESDEVSIDSTDVDGVHREASGMVVPLSLLWNIRGSRAGRGWYSLIVS